MRVDLQDISRFDLVYDPSCMTLRFTLLSNGSITNRLIRLNNVSHNELIRLLGDFYSVRNSPVREFR